MYVPLQITGAEAKSQLENILISFESNGTYRLYQPKANLPNAKLLANRAKPPRNPSPQTMQWMYQSSLYLEKRTRSCSPRHLRRSPQEYPNLPRCPPFDHTNSLLPRNLQEVPCRQDGLERCSCYLPEEERPARGKHECCPTLHTSSLRS